MAQSHRCKFPNLSRRHVSQFAPPPAFGQHRRPASSWARLARGGSPGNALIRSAHWCLCHRRSQREDVMAELQSVGWRSPMLKAHNVQVVDHRQIAELATRARAVPRKRAHLLLHEGPTDSVQRLIILLQPNTYVRPHHHSRQWEMLVLQQGRGNLLVFDGDARLMDRIELNPRSSMVQIPIGVWHGFVVLERNTAVLEIKPGPYVPNEFADWAPEEGDATATRFVKWITNAAPGERWSLTQPAVRASRVIRDEVE